ncbi:MAG: hypothetical protein RLZZ491_2709 [Pseudomonadota bacterium]
MPYRIEHFLYATPARLKRLRAALPDGIAVATVAGGLVLDAIIAALARALDLFAVWDKVT